MAKTYNRLEIDVNKKPTDIITAVQADSNSRYLDVSLFNNGVPLDLTGHEVKIFMAKPEESGEIWNDGVITNAKEGRCEFLMTAEALSKVGHLQTQISIWKDNTEILSTQVFEINVTKTLLGNSSVESSNEYGTLVLLFQNLYEAYALMTDMVSSFGKMGAVADARNIATFWQGVEYLAKYMDTDLKGLLEKAIANSSVQGVLDLIGNTGDTGNSTVMGKENQIINGMKNVMPLYRHDDYLAHQLQNTFVILNNQEKSTIYDKPIKIGTITIPANCYKIVVKGNFKGDSVQINFVDSSNNNTYSSNYIDGASNVQYNRLKATMQGDEMFPQGQYDVYFYKGSRGTAYCNNLQIEVYTLERVITEALYTANTIKSYGGGAQYFAQCPRLDRVIITPYSSGYSGVGITVLCDDIPYIYKPFSYYTYRILY